ncbi:hypothetical protein ASG67_07830 [Sphingomonas sp. Leaf339]|uniref:hypothetical protein n=1 Tax=Sphingomonas sp. Leaf339 TaxID=1736343 RepID=UPI0007007655|nr:hypothetical protein [Sphingomonas sp. Leaf339]KQU55982.1 hypothetical protein ASG67_07830 [Sphingomonas sp. Leaf339]
MFVDFRNAWPPPEPWQPKPQPPRISRRGESVLAWILGFNLLMLFLGPLAGATVIDAVVALFRS